MNEEKMYAVKNDKGVWLSLDSSHESVWYTNNPTLFKDKSYAEAQAGPYGHVVELVEPEKVVLTKEQAEIVEKANKRSFPAYYITQQTFVSDDEELLMKAYVNGYTVVREKRYLVELDGLVTTDGSKQYLTNKDGKWFASRRISGLHQDFTDEELNNAPEWVKQLNREEVTDDGE